MQPWTSGLLPSFFPAWLPLGTDISKLHISSSEQKSASLDPGREPSGRRSRLPALPQHRPARGKARRHEGGKASLQPGLGWRVGTQPLWDAGTTLGLPRRASRKGSRLGALGSRLPGKPPSSCTSWASEGGLATLSRPSEEANKLLLQNNGAGEGVRAGWHSVHRAH